MNITLIFILIALLCPPGSLTGNANSIEQHSPPDNPSQNNGVVAPAAPAAASDCSDEMCALCLEEGYPNGGKCKIDSKIRKCDQHQECIPIHSACNHEFCRECINELKNSIVAARRPITCPMCRAPKGCLFSIPPKYSWTIQFFKSMALESLYNYLATEPSIPTTRLHLLSRENYLMSNLKLQQKQEQEFYSRLISIEEGGYRSYYERQRLKLTQIHLNELSQFSWQMSRALDFENSVYHIQRLQIYLRNRPNFALHALGHILTRSDAIVPPSTDLL